MLSIIIVNYRQKSYLAECVESIYNKLPSGSYEIIVVNNSPEESLDDIAVKFPGIKIITNENTGYSKANNLAAEQAKGEYLFFLNADTRILEDFTKGLFDRLKNLEFGAIGLKLQFEDGSFQNSFGLFPTIFNEYKNRKTEIEFSRHNEQFISRHEKEYSGIKETDWVSGAAMLVRKKVFDSIGGFDERYFLYYEDIDLCFRLHKAGYKNYFYSYSRIIHYKGEYTRRKEKPRLKNIQNSSHRLYYKTHNSFIQELMLNLILMIK